MAKKKSNVDLVIDLMTYSPYGGLSQSFIIQAIRNLSNQVIEKKEELLKMEGEKMQPIFMEAWVGIAEDIKKRMDEFYEFQK